MSIINNLNRIFYYFFLLRFMHKCESQHARTHAPRTSSLHVKQTLSLSLSLSLSIAPDAQ
jgi:hypothetical protein